MSTTNTSSSKLIREPINDDYEWIQYNNQLRIIHSINDDMYQMQSIINACESIKQPKNWFDNTSTKELLSEFELENGSRGIPLNRKAWEKRVNLPNNLKGYYVHRLLVNAVAMWASPRYSLRIFTLLDKIATEERDELAKMVEAKETKIIEQKPRLVPRKKEKRYRYLIWQEELPNDPDMILLHLVRRNTNSFRQVTKHLNNEHERWFFRDNLPIAMTLNEDVKDLVRQTLPGSEYDIDGSTILTYKEHLPRLHDVIAHYFDEFQK